MMPVVVSICRGLLCGGLICGGLICGGLISGQADLQAGVL